MEFGYISCRFRILNEVREGIGFEVSAKRQVLFSFILSLHIPSSLAFFLVTSLRARNLKIQSPCSPLSSRESNGSARLLKFQQISHSWTEGLLTSHFLHFSYRFGGSNHLCHGSISIFQNTAD